MCVCVYIYIYIYIKLALLPVMKYIVRQSEYIRRLYIDQIDKLKLTYYINTPK